MLVLTRKLHERVEIMGGLVTVEIVGIDKGQIRLGFDAPPEIDIDREEVAQVKRDTA